MFMEGGSNTDISINNAVESGYASTLKYKYIYIKMIVYTTDGKSAIETSNIYVT